MEVLDADLEQIKNRFTLCLGKELVGMLSGKWAHPKRALDVIERLRLAGLVFAFPGTFPGDQECIGGPLRGRTMGVKYACTMGASASAAAGKDANNRGDDDTDPAAELAVQYGARGWEESRLLLSVLLILIQGQIDEREKLSTKPRLAKGDCKYANLASSLTSAD